MAGPGYHGRPCSPRHEGAGVVLVLRRRGRPKDLKEIPQDLKTVPPGSKGNPRQALVTILMAPAGHKEGGASHSALARVGSGAGADPRI